LGLNISPTQSNVQAAVGAFLAAVLPGLSGSAPAVFVGAISGTTLTVTSLPAKQPAGIQGFIQDNAPLLGLGVAPGTTIVTQLTGSPSGGIGTYQVSISQSVPNAPMSTGITIVAGQQNRVAEPVNPFFAVVTPMRVDRLSTSVDAAADVKFQGSISGTTLTVSTVDTGILTAGASIFGLGVTNPTIIIKQLTGSPGGTGTYQVSPSQAVGAETLSAGAKTITQNAEWTLQLDFHSPDTTAGDLAMTVSTALRDPYGVDFFAGLAPPLNGVVPLYADDPRQVPFVNDQNQVEYRWSLDCCLQVDQTVVVSQQYSDSATVTLKDVTALYPP
jgi:hypothetical protein